MIAQWPEADTAFLDEQAENQMMLLMELTKGIRNCRAEYNVPPSKRITAYINAGQWAELLNGNRALFSRLANVEDADLVIASELSQLPEQSASVTVTGVTVYLPLAGLVDLDAERARLKKEIESTMRQIERTEKLLAGDGFVNRAPAEVVQRERDKLESLQATREALHERLAGLS
jgi:valyl-tRNA synthetase